MAADNSNRRSGLSGTRRPTEASPVGKLLDDLLIDILVRGLPDPRSVSRCKVVCKRWRLLLSSPAFNRRFISDHWRRNKQPPLLLFSDDRHSNILGFLPMPNTVTVRRYFDVLDSYKDLVLCGFEGVGHYHSPELYRSYFLCNPFTKQWVALPLAPPVPVGWIVTAARLVCEPRISNNLDLGDDVVFVHSEYRFCVVCLYRDRDIRSTKLHVFSSDTGEWTKEILILPNHMIQDLNSVVSCNGELFWVCRVPRAPAAMLPVPPFVVAFNPFRPDKPLTPIHPPLVDGPAAWDISFSQGALHAVLYLPILPSLTASSVWRLEPDRKLWRKVCEAMVKIPCGPGRLPGLQLHPGKPEVMVWLNDASPGRSYVWTCNLETRGEPEFLTEITTDKPHWKMLHAGFPCWPTPIPRYEKLRAMYDGSYSCWVQSN